MRVDDIKVKPFVLEVVIDDGVLIFKNCVQIAPGNDAVVQEIERRVRFLLWQQKSANEENMADGTDELLPGIVSEVRNYC